MPAQNGRMEIIMAKKGLGKGLGALFDTEDSKVFYPEKDKTSENTVVNIKISLSPASLDALQRLSPAMIW